MALQRRYVHSKTSGEHQGINFSIAEDGKVTISSISEEGGEYDEITIPASLIFKLGVMLRATVKVHMIEEEIK